MALQPTKAEKEFEGDCFGVARDGDCDTCKLCMVTIQCAAAMWKRTQSQPPEPLIIIPKAPRPRVRMRGHEGGFRMGSSAWACYRAFVTREGRFTKQDAMAAYRVLAQTYGIKIGNAERNMRKVIEVLSRTGRLRKDGPNEYHLEALHSPSAGDPGS
jgi:hypothetical protein